MCSSILLLTTFQRRSALTVFILEKKCTPPKSPAGDLGGAYLQVRAFSDEYLEPLLPKQLKKGKNMLDIRNKWVLLTGASRGIGKQVATALAEKGCNLILHSRNLEHTKILAL
jgi:hypothetical protein